jgi:ABC-type bacteriocin/lantibiotic exporter with double-glycine peptidase domain
MEVIRQRSSADCGAAALAMVATALGVPTSLERARDLAGTTERGTTLAGLVEGADALGVPARAVHVRGEPDRLPLPAIVHWRRHYVVLESLTPRHVHVVDPARGRRRLRRRRFAAGFSGYAIELMVPSTEHVRSLESGAGDRGIAPVTKGAGR